MARRFRGEYTQKVDGKGRVSIPSRYRRVIESGDPDWVEGKPAEFVIVYGDESQQYLECYTIDSMDELEDKIAKLPNGPDRTYMIDRYQAFSLEMSVDETGRIVLSKKLRDKLDIDEEAYFIAQGACFQVWKPEAYDRIKKAKIEDYLAEKPEDFDPLTLLNDVRSE